MTILRASARPTRKAPPDRFTGDVWQDEVVVPTAPSRMRATNVAFAPGARTAWHSHPVGQVLYVLSGVGRIQFKGEAVQLLQPGDTAVIPPNVVHWHGAAPDRLFVHLAMSESTEDGGSTEWFDLVSDADYAKEPASLG